MFSSKALSFGFRMTTLLVETTRWSIGLSLLPAKIEPGKATALVKVCM